jgi:multiple sugar transport system substrate-binding protein
LDAPEAVEAIQWWADLIHTERVSPNAVEIGGSNPNALFQQGRLAIYIDGTWNIAGFEGLPFRWDVAAIPARAGVSPTTFLHASYYTISSTTRNPEAAWRWLSFIVAPEAQRERSSLMRYLPTRASVNAEAPFLRADAPPPNAALISNVLPTARMAPVAPNNTRIITVFERELTLVYLGEKTAEQAMSDAAREINQLLTR